VYKRKSAVAAAWPATPCVFGGRDLEAGGSWLGITRHGRFAVVTNVREPYAPTGEISRGLLVSRFLTETCAPLNYMKTLSGDKFSGFNLLVGDTQTLYYGSNRGAACQRLEPGIYGISNHLLDTPWPKLITAKANFTKALQTLPEEEHFFTLLADDEIVPDPQLPSTGIPLEWERRLSAIFIRSPGYGTRASTIILRSQDARITLSERSFDKDGFAGQVHLSCSPE